MNRGPKRRALGTAFQLLPPLAGAVRLYEAGTICSYCISLCVLCASVGAMAVCGKCGFLVMLRASEIVTIVRHACSDNDSRAARKGTTADPSHNWWQRWDRCRPAAAHGLRKQIWCACR
uniref:Putative secreted protein n=1 Tax=Amblyomma cajennense TaxID=34607 RepID=A0A023FE01_AMBCJ